MSYQSAKRIPLSEKQWIFAGGFVDNANNFELAPHFSPYLRNVRLDGQWVVARPWCTEFVSLTSWSYPKGIGTNAVTNKLIVRHNTDSTHKLYNVAEDGTLESIDTSTNITSDNRMNFTNAGDTVYCLNGSDNFGKLVWTTYTTPSTWISNFAPAFSVIFNSSHWASWCSTNPNKVYKSVWDNFEDFNSTWSDQFTFEEAITGLCANNEALFYFTKNTISVTGKSDILEASWSLTYNTTKLTTKEWSNYHNTVVTAWTSIYYLSNSNSINQIARWNNINWFEIIGLSDRKYKGITKILWTLDKDQSSAFGYFLPEEMLVKWHVKTAGSTINDLIIVYDIEKDAFLVDNGKYFYGGLYFNGKNYTISIVEPKVFYDEIYNDDDGTAIQWEYRTKEFYISEPTMQKLLRESRTLLDVNELAQVNQSIYLDGISRDSKTLLWNSYVDNSWWIGIWSVGEESVWDNGWDSEEEYTETYILRDKWHLWQTPQRKKVQRRFTGWTIWEKVRLKNISARIEMKSELSTNLTK